MKMSGAGRAQLRHTEKVVLKYYDDGGSGKGHCTYGPGLLVHRGPCTAEELTRKVSIAGVEASFDSRLRDAERAVERNVKVSLTQEQFDALVSYVYNSGSRGSIPLYDKLNANDFPGAAAIISGSIRSKQKDKRGRTIYVLMPGLMPRRARESAPFRKSN